MDREILERRYFELGNQLLKIYPQLSFENHCYWRIALDAIIGNKWNTQIGSPAYKNLSSSQLEKVVAKLNLYKEDKNTLLQDNLKSLEYRKR